MDAAQVMYRPVVTVRCDETWRDALRLLLGASLNAVSVVDREGCIVGIVTQTDLAARVQGPERAAMRAMLDGVIAAQSHRTLLRWHQAPRFERYAAVETVMTAPPITVQADASLAEVARLLLAHDIEQVPVVTADHRPIGLVRQRDLVAALAAGEQPAPPVFDAFAAWAYS